MPRDLVGMACLRSRSTQRGIFASFSPLIDPGFRGGLIFLVWKPENPNLDFPVGDLFQVMFFKVGEIDVSYNERKNSTAMERKGFGTEDNSVESGQFAQY
jgi:deoxycytidine triphosphate deaminase